MPTINKNQDECPNNAFEILRHENSILKQEIERIKKDNIELGNQIEKINSENSKLKGLSLSIEYCYIMILEFLILV